MEGFPRTDPEVRRAGVHDQIVGGVRGRCHTGGVHSERVDDRKRDGSRLCQDRVDWRSGVDEEAASSSLVGGEDVLQRAGGQGRVESVGPIQGDDRREVGEVLRQCERRCRRLKSECQDDTRQKRGGREHSVCRRGIVV
jgi:hypothetical protein